MRRLNLIQGTLAAATFVTVLAFFPVAPIRTVMSQLLYVLWALLLLLLFLHNRKIWGNNRVLWMVLAYLGCVIATKIAMRIGDHPANSGVGVAKFFPICIAFYFVGYNYTIHVEDAIRRLLRALCIGICLVAIAVLLQGGITSAKNQFGQLLGVVVILSLLILPRYVEQKQRVWYILGGAISLITLFVIRSRTPVIGIAIAAFVHLLPYSKKNGKTLFLRMLLMIIGVVGVIIAVETGVLDNLFKGFSPQLGRDITLSEAVGDSESMDIVLSGRLTHYQIAWNDFLRQPLFGVGAWAYIDNFVMHTLRTGGLWHALCLLPLVYGTLFSASARFRKALVKDQTPAIVNMLYEILRDAALFYFIESMGEGYPPIGPGTSVFFLWLLLGIGDQMIATASRSEKQDEKAVEE